MRREMTEAETVLWQALKNKRLGGVRFRRQHPVGRFVLDFYAPLHHLVVEVDGGIHERQKERDIDRSALLEAYGLRIVRVTNEEVFNDLPSACRRILEAAFSPAS